MKTTRNYATAFFMYVGRLLFKIKAAQIVALQPPYPSLQMVTSTDLSASISCLGEFGKVGLGKNGIRVRIQKKSV